MNENRLTSDLNAVVQDAENLVNATAGEVGEKAAAARSRLTQTINAVKATGERLQGKALEGAKATDRLVRDHPYPSLGVVFALGLLIGVLVNRRNRD